MPERSARSPIPSGRHRGAGRTGLRVEGGSTLELAADGAAARDRVDLVAEDWARVEPVRRRSEFQHGGRRWATPEVPSDVPIVGRKPRVRSSGVR